MRRDNRDARQDEYEDNVVWTWQSSRNPRCDQKRS